MNQKDTYLSNYCVAPLAHTYTLDLLKRHGNEVSADHSLALSALCQLSEECLQGRLLQRIRFGLPCGMGKTTAVRAVIRAVATLGLNYRIAVASSKVEDQCRLKRLLIGEDGIPADKVGVVHSYEFDSKKAAEGRPGYASEPSENHGAQFVLVTHARLRSEAISEDLISRDLVFFDESLIAGDALLVAFANKSPSCVRAELGSLRAIAEGVELEAVAMLSELETKIQEQVECQLGDDVTIHLGEVDPSLVSVLRQMRSFQDGQYRHLAVLLDMAEAAQELRLFRDSETRASLLSYRVAVPDRLSRVIVLDASDPIRKLVHYDHRMVRAESISPLLSKFAASEGGMSSIKKYKDVQVYFACDPGGRSSMKQSFESEDKPWALEKLVRLVKSKSDESFLVFTYKQRESEQTNYVRKVRSALKASGIDPDEVMPDGTKRVATVTWGNETGINDYADYGNVVLLGVIFQPVAAVASRYLGQRSDVRAPGLHKIARELTYAECHHVIYQAMNRCRMRQTVVKNGVAQAKPCSIYVWHRDSNLEEALSAVLAGSPGWRPWREVGEGVSSLDVAMKIRNHLSTLYAQEVYSVSLRKLKADVAANVPRATWCRGRDLALETECLWSRRGGSLVVLFGQPFEQILSAA